LFFFSVTDLEGGNDAGPNRVEVDDVVRYLIVDQIFVLSRVLRAVASSEVVAWKLGSNSALTDVACVAVEGVEVEEEGGEKSW
jgi:hypothetical protein